MAKVHDKMNPGCIEDLLAVLPDRAIPKVQPAADIRQIIDVLVGSCHSRLVYVVDDRDVLLGVVTLGDIIRHVFFHYHDAQVEAKQLMSMAISETAADFMQKELVCATREELLEEVLSRMIAHRVKEVPVVDSDKKLVADLTIVDILCHFKESKGDVF